MVKIDKEYVESVVSEIKEWSKEIRDVVSMDLEDFMRTRIDTLPAEAGRFLLLVGAS